MSTVKKVIGTFLCLWGAYAHAQEKLIWKSNEYALYTDKVVQGEYTARAVNGSQIISDYQSPTNLFKSAAITFKFSINGKDNEMTSGIDHQFIFPEDQVVAETPLIEFGKQIKPASNQKPGFLQPGATLKLRLDLRKVLNSFKEQGFYTTFNGQKIYESDFKGVYVAGGTAPMTWDFDNLMHFSHLELKDEEGDGIYEIVLEINKVNNDAAQQNEWNQSKDLSAYPQLVTDHPMMQAMYQLSLEEMLNAIEPDSTLRTGQEWAGVWTRDVSYSILLSMASLQPQVSKISLLKKVNRKGVIVQDTGTGGAWPISTDRIVWAVAAWEIYKVTGDKKWLEEAYQIIKKTLDVDIENILDPTTKLVKGESSFLDWREQTYPKWMEPTDIFESLTLGTNAVFYQSFKILSIMSEQLNKKAESKKYEAYAQQIKNAINQHLWMDDKGYYAQYLYGRDHKLQSPRAETLGEALTILFDIANEDQQRKIIANMPMTPFGAACIFPQIPNIPPYHNNGIWPFVQSYWLLASAKAKNESAVLEGIASIYRPAALFLTNKENFVAENGDYLGTQINSSNMLWSLSGNLSIIHKVIFGIYHEDEFLSFRPFIPSALKGNYELKNYKYRNATLNIKVSGYGDAIKSFTINGVPTKDFILSADQEGAFEIVIEMNQQFEHDDKNNRQPVLFTLAAPNVTYNNNQLNWQPIEGAVNYWIYANGKKIAEQKNTNFAITDHSTKEYQVIAVDQLGMLSFASEPVIHTTSVVIKEELEKFAPASSKKSNGFSGEGFIETSNDENNDIHFTINAPAKGKYLVRIQYANGNGAYNTDNKCAIRLLKVNNKKQSIFVFPQRGQDEWSEWVYSNYIVVPMKKGKNKINIVKTPDQDNMHIDINHAYLDYIEFIKQ